MKTSLPTYEFHISKKARDRFHFNEIFFSITGDVIFSDARSAQSFAAAISEKKGQGRRSSVSAAQRIAAGVSASEINAMGLFHEVLHYVIASYVKQNNPDAFNKLESWLREKVGDKQVAESEMSFVEMFPPTSVYRKEEAANDFISKTDAGVPRKHVVLEELILLWLENRNPAFGAISELIDDSGLRKKTSYDDVLAKTDAFFETQPGYGPADSQLMKMLLAPIEASPDSIAEQLQFIAKNWTSILENSPLLMRILRAIDFIKEEGKYFLMLAQAQADKSRIPSVRQAGFGGFGDRGSEPVPRFRGTGSEFEPENFSTDLSWMPRLVLIAKNAFVWLDQLSKKYQRHIARLDQIPDEELEALSRRGFTGLWLIGIWIRSAASQKIKHLNGNRDAIASAYSLHSYDIAQELGGEEAYRNLRDRASRYGIRLASDMVPNHMGIDSTWVIEHPDWFLTSDYQPYPNYSFNGPDLSGDERVGIFVEDGYWSKRDAAVVFKRLDRWTGDVRYVYHGNDGTHMPWNDTAQLDFTKPEVREAVIQTILHVARMFPIIRFDAAMVLSKKHYQRLWFPEPGTGGAIPSRSNFSMTKEQFDSVIPVEFWREVVDRIQKEAPDTLLLAEAFWLMEGYFVRTLGMHRVYNSAFMNMLKREENANYRQVIKNILEYNPQILKRFVNFVNNPDEDTAIAQFGKDDKYFGVCVMMATMPGLPMFGHGQIEGLTEKYGMEFKRAYRDELPDEGLVARHEREIFPLLRLRHRFSEMDNFVLYDFFTGEGFVNEDVFAYSNGTGSERNLVVYNNRYTHTAGWIKTSVAFHDASGKLVQKNLADGLFLSAAAHAYCIFRDAIAGVEYIRPVKSMRREGLFIELGAYKYSVFMDFREVHATKEMPFDELCRVLNGRGVTSVEDELHNMKLQGVHAAFYEAINAGSLKYLAEGLRKGSRKHERAEVAGEKAERLEREVLTYRRRHGKANGETASSRYNALLSLSHYFEGETSATRMSKLLPVEYDKSLSGWRVIFLWLFLDVVDRACAGHDKEEKDLIGEFRLSVQVRNCFAELGVESGLADYETALADELVRDVKDFGGLSTGAPEKMFEAMLAKESVQRFIEVHYYENVRWFNRERFDDLIEYFIAAVSVNHAAGRGEHTKSAFERKIDELVKAGASMKRLAARCNYRFDELVGQLSYEPG